MTTATVLRSAFWPKNQQFRFVLLDCIWRLLWGVVSLVVVLFAGAGILSQLASLEWQGPDLGGSSPIIALAALRELWSHYGAYVLASVGLLLLGLTIFWIALESLFRGGWKGLWIYVGTGVSRTALLLGTASIFMMLSLRDESGGTFLIGVVVMLAMWFVVGLFETVVRRNASDLLATSLLPLSAVMGCMRLAEGILAFLLLGSAVLALSSSSEIALSMLFAGFVVMFWMIAQSYLVAVRYSAIDIMRRNVADS